MKDKTLKIIVLIAWILFLPIIIFFKPSIFIEYVLWAGGLLFVIGFLELGRIINQLNKKLGGEK